MIDNLLGLAVGFVGGVALRWLAGLLDRAAAPAEGGDQAT